MQCPICFNSMQRGTSPKLEWLNVCSKCDFSASSLSPGIGAEVAGIENLRKANFGSILDALKPYADVSLMSALEVGSSRGWFLDEARNHGLNCLGIEPDILSTVEAKAKGHTVYEGMFPDVLSRVQQQFDLIIFNDVFEHLSDIRSAKASIHQFLKPQGLLVLNLPDSRGILYKIAKILASLGWYEFLERLWQKDMNSPHLSYFNRRNLTELFTADGTFSLLKVDRLESMQIRGLWTRIRSGGQGKLISFFIYIPLLLIALSTCIFPSDIQLVIFRKTA